MARALPTVRELQIELPELTPSQQLVCASTARFRVLACGRRWGKSVGAGGYEAMRESIERDEALTWWVTPTQKEFESALEAMNNVTHEIKSIKHRINQAKIHCFNFPNGSVVQFHTGKDPENLRGRGLTLAILDEFSDMHPKTWSVLRPALSDRVGRALFLSSPKGHNELYTLYNKCAAFVESDGTGQENWQYLRNKEGDPLWMGFRFTTYDNPIVKREEIEQMKKDMTDRQFRQEILAQFIDDSSSVFSNIYEMAISEETGPQPGHVYVFGIDLAQVTDYTCVIVVDVTEMRQVKCLLTNNKSWEAMIAEIAFLSDLYKPVTVWVEDNNNKSVIERLMSFGVPAIAFHTGPTTKGPLIESWAMAIEHEEMMLLNDREVINQHLAYEVEQTRMGNLRYGAPGGQHDDIVMASAIAWYGVSQAFGRRSGLLQGRIQNLYRRAAPMPRPRGIVNEHSAQEIFRMGTGYPLSSNASSSTPRLPSGKSSRRQDRPSGR